MSAVEDLTEVATRAASAECVARSLAWQDRSAIAKKAAAARAALDAERTLLHRPDISAVQPSATWANRLSEIAHPCVPVDDPRVHHPAPAGPAANGSTAGRPAAAEPAAGEPTDAGSAGGDRADLAALAEADASAATAARIALGEAHLAVLQARLAALDAGDDVATAARIRGHATLVDAHPALRHVRTLGRGVRAELHHILHSRPRSVATKLGISLGIGLAYLGFLRIFHWDDQQENLPYLAMFALSSVIGGVACTNALSFDARRVRAALAGGTRLWHLLVIKNLALLILVGAAGLLLSALVTWSADDPNVLIKACGLLLTMVLLWLGVGNLLSVGSPLRAEPLPMRRRDGTLTPFLVAFAVSYGVGYVVNLMLYWQIWAKRSLLEQIGGIWLPTLMVVASATVMWLLLTVLAVSLAQQPRVRRSLIRELVDYREAKTAAKNPVSDLEVHSA